MMFIMYDTLRELKIWKQLSFKFCFGFLFCVAYQQQSSWKFTKN